MYALINNFNFDDIQGSETNTPYTFKYLHLYNSNSLNITVENEGYFIIDTLTTNAISINVFNKKKDKLFNVVLYRNNSTKLVLGN